MPSSREAGAVLAVKVMPGIPGNTVPIVGMLAMKSMERLFSAHRHGAVVSMAWIIAFVYVAVPPVRPVVPGSSADKDATAEPVRPVIAVRCTIVRGIREIAIRTN